ncbi:hypothetical protein POM88_044150 [Heracleum sosnowskyi]|uniref:Ubiquitin-like protease family profile domain-containing protein n=1 Tax=Heracleum sosnowskyi TaxID=360622 RepID=A0AAD8H389_9APIA|nr:hypothetical protein POM88_044150 [Heracleum sosnowskyi]
MKAAMLMDAVEQYSSQLHIANNMHPNDNGIADIEGKITNVIEKLNVKKESVPETENDVRVDNGINVQLETEEIDPFELDHIELLEYLYSSQGKRDMELDIENMSISSFSLGIDDPIPSICKDIMKEHGNEGDVEHKTDEIDAKTPEEMEKTAYRSPYVLREIDITKNYTSQEYAMWRWMMKEGKKDKVEHLFQNGDQYCIREHIESLMPQQNLVYSVMDVWSTLLNEKEKYKATESPLHLFFDIGLSIELFDERKSEDAQYETYSVQMDRFFERYSNIKIQEYDLFFFPIMQDENFYLICINKKE